MYSIQCIEHNQVQIVVFLLPIYPQLENRDLMFLSNYDAIVVFEGDHFIITKYPTELYDSKSHITYLASVMR